MPETSPTSTPEASAAESSLLRRIWLLLHPYRGWLVLVGVAIVVSSLLGVVNPFLTRAVFDRALFPTDGSGVHLTLLLWLVVAMIAVTLAGAVIGVGQSYLTTKVGNLSMADLRERLFAHLEKMELAFFTSTKTGSIQSRLSNDVGGVRSVLTTTASSILSNVVTVAASLIAMLLLSWQLTLLAVALLPGFVYLQRRVGARRRVLARKTQESLSEMTAITEEALSVSGVLLTKVFNQADTELDRYRAENARQTELQVRQAMTGQGFFAVVGAFMAITPALVYLLAGYLISDGSGPVISAGTLVAFSTLQARLLQPLVSLMRVTLDVQTSMALFRRIFEYLDLQPAIVDSQGAVDLPADSPGRVELDDVHFAYPPPVRLTTADPDPVVLQSLGRGGGGLRSGGGMRGAATTAVSGLPTPVDSAVEPGERRGRRWAVAGTSLMIEPGQLAAFVGPSGAGKTSLCYLVPRLYEVDSGAVRVDGHDVRDLTMSSLAEAVGMVTQDPYLLHASVADNLRYAKPDATDAELHDAASAANIHDRVLGFEDGYDTLVGERGFRLSGGEKQRLAIARVLLKNPRVLILDEATSALDTVSERLVQRALAEVMRGRTTLAIAHRLSTIQHADVIFVIDDGTLIESGTHAELLAHRGLYARLHAEQFGGGQVECRCTDGVRFTDGTVLTQTSPSGRRGF
ncbi:ABC transporter ATP-binding protein [Rhodococcus marinonascens]|uniref:ABC transporter ATP-binding protein n=1 Tax=Rhodococcus marinonascens TaxID=38311 RepID=UPI0009343ACD|nr:ABC transporter ATP-binding protein [Rhodococcus marinonascens]